MTDNFDEMMLSMVLNDEDGEQQVIPIVKGEDADETPRIKDDDTIAVLPLKNMVLFPGVLLPVTITRPKSVRLVQQAYKKEELIGVFSQTNQEAKDPQAKDIFPLGVAARVLRMFDMPDGSHVAILEGLEQILMQEYVAINPVRRVRIQVVEEVFPSRRDKHFQALAENIKEQATFILERSTNMPQEATSMLHSIGNPVMLINYVSVNFNLTIEQKQELLRLHKLVQRGEKLLEFLLKEAEMVKTRVDIQEKAAEKMNQEHREYYLQHQLEAIQKELGDTDTARCKSLRERAEKKNWPEHAKAAFDEMMKKVEREPSHSPDYQMDVTYLETMLDLPWNECTEDNYDIRQAKKVLDKDHYGMEKVKERIIEYLAVLKQTNAANSKDVKAPILCLYGAPGVGKTSLGKSIATALGRKYARVSLGGLHDEQMMREADYILDIGPRAGRLGGELIFSGTPAELLKADTLTAQYLRGEKTVSNERLAVSGQQADVSRSWLTLTGCTGNNLKHVTLRVPLGMMVCVTGVSGSGKSTLINHTLYPILSQHFYRSLTAPLPYESIEGLEHIDKVINVDQSPIGRTPRSNPATYTNVFTDIRELFASLPESKIRGWKQNRFSFNAKGGRCEECSGNGYKTLRMNFMPDIYTPCDVCGGARYNRQTLEVRFKGKTISDILDMTVNQSVEFFESQPYILRKIKSLQDVGLGYIKLGQSSTTLSGGESQRVKLATELARPSTGKTVYILDEPTTGLHFDDIRVLMGVLRKLVDKGNTVIIIEHNLDVIRACDYLIDLGPEGGNAGGQIIAEGTVAQMREQKGNSITAQYL